MTFFFFLLFFPFILFFEFKMLALTTRVYTRNTLVSFFECKIGHVMPDIYAKVCKINKKHILLKEIDIDGQRVIDHMWVPINKNMRRKLKYNSVIKYDGTVEKYKRKDGSECYKIVIDDLKKVY